MIQLQITNLLDPDRDGEYQFFTNQQLIGSSIDCDLYFPLNSLIDKHFQIEITEEQCLFTNLDDSSHFWIDKKKTIRSKKIKQGTLISFHHIEMKVISFEFTKFKNLKDELNHITQNIVPQDQDLAELLFSITSAEDETL